MKLKKRTQVHLKKITGMECNFFVHNALWANIECVCSLWKTYM